MPRYIDADSALAFPLANGKYDRKNANKHFIYGCETYKEYLEQLPTISPDEARGVGKWEKTDAFPHRVYCSNCFKTIVPNEEYAFWCEGIMPRNYCPNCGAKMEVSEDA